MEKMISGDLLANAFGFFEGHRFAYVMLILVLLEYTINL